MARTTRLHMTVRFDDRALLLRVLRQQRYQLSLLEWRLYCLSGWRHPKPELTSGPAEDILCSDPACVLRTWTHSHPDGWPEHPDYKGPLNVQRPAASGEWPAAQ